MAFYIILSVYELLSNASIWNSLTNARTHAHTHMHAHIYTIWNRLKESFFLVQVPS